MPYLRLALAIIERALLDAMNGRDYTAWAYVRSEDFDRWCELTGVSAPRLRERLVARLNERPQRRERRR